MEEDKSLNFIEQIIEQDLASGKHKEIYTRFPPEPNGYLHIGHAKAICLNFGLGEQYNGKVNLRFDDTNPTAEKQEYVDAIKENITWLGYKWEKELHTSDHFQQLYEYAVQLIKQHRSGEMALEIFQHFPPQAFNGVDVLERLPQVSVHSNAPPCTS